MKSAKLTQFPFTVAELLAAARWAREHPVVFRLWNHPQPETETERKP